MGKTITLLEANKPKMLQSVINELYSADELIVSKATVEKEEREQAILLINEKIDLLKNDLDGKNSVFEQALDNEANQRQQNDNAFEQALNTEIAQRKQKDDEQDNIISSEAATRSQEISALQSTINAEANQRAGQDLLLGEQIVAEAGIRQAAIASLGSQVSVLQEQATALNNAIIAEQTARTTGDISLQESMNAEILERTSAIAMLTTQLNDEMIARTSSDEHIINEILPFKADLDRQTGKVLSSQLPSYVDDIDEFPTKADFPLVGVGDKIYLDKQTNKIWRWSGSVYAEVSPSLALGTTPNSAFRGDLGNEAYEHSQKASGNPHNTTKNEIGLGNVPNLDTAQAVQLAHSHSNKLILDDITAAFTLAEKEKLANAASSSQIDGAFSWFTAQLGGKADLENGVLKDSQVPESVRDILWYDKISNFPKPGIKGKFYVDKQENKTYYWDNNIYEYIPVLPFLGEYSTTAFRGDYGKIAYDHSQVLSGNPHMTIPQDIGAEPAIENKGSAFNKNFGTFEGEVCEGNDTRLSDPRPASDVFEWAKKSTPPSAEDIGLGNVANERQYSEQNPPPLATATQAGMIKMRIDGDTVYFTNDGSDA